ncbi:ATPase (AAA+ superfamily)-like protein [Thermocrinis albus DSM 14484]|uniref:ATPase (AAA+ superfamily)-like protein n=1 Tax=Thermocrinis albus (strain DSM 14484 / JCM 11386 / HI 11/12) TaxID=638303 RepID=D3SN90_THEAH|nr:ATP-binding protein [Thermocrinis albus]ADC90220.1 ATPase (AAA+ superfamily)-like protein [Thermocrinis albus DSM 14484]
MKPFVQIAQPHRDIVEGKLTMDVFAADLWEVVKGTAKQDYQDPHLFFSKTYMTNGLKNILDIAKERLEGKRGDAIIQLQTPFGGGKTHTLIALYHKAREWGAKVAVFDGTAPDPRDVRPWEEIERQLTGEVKLTKGDISPGKEKLAKLLEENAPVLILMDEILAYATKSAGVKIGDSDLSAQTLAFIQELTGAVSSVGNALLVLTLPSSILELYDENAQRILETLTKIIGRTAKIYAPVGDEEIEHVVRARLFEKVDESEAKKVVNEFVEYAKREGLLSEDEAENYRQKFLRSYPFKPEVIDVLYKRWGSFPTFQRTRGVLRLLSLVIYDLMKENKPFIRLGDFNLNNKEIRRELIEHIGSEWDSIIAQDITSDDAGAKKVDAAIGSAYTSYKLGTKVSTTIFMMSFSGRGERGTSIREIKHSVALPELPSSVIDTTINHLKEKLYYLSDDGLFFTNQANLNKIIVDREGVISDDEIYEEEKNIVNKYLPKSSPVFKWYINPQFSRDVPDSPELKLIILDRSKPEDEFLEKCGELPRVYKNTLIFLCIDENQKSSFHSYLRKMLALRSIENDKSLNLSEAQRKEVKSKLKDYEQREYEELRKLYRRVFVPAKDGFKEVKDNGGMGLPTVGKNSLDGEVYSYLKGKGEVLEQIIPELIAERYLKEKDYVEIKNLYESFLRTPGEIRPASKDVFLRSIEEGVKKGLFGFGYIVNGQIECKYIKETPSVNLTDEEVIIKPDLCEKTPKEITQNENKAVIKAPSSSLYEKQTTLEREEPADKNTFSEITLELVVPVGQISTIAKIINYLKDKFQKNNVEVTLHASDGKITKEDYEDKVIEALKQAGIKIIRENLS